MLCNFKTLGPTARFAAIVVGAVIVSTQAQSADQKSIWDQVDISGELAFEQRLFLQSAPADEQLDSVQSSGYFEPRVRWRSADRKNQVQFIPYVRVDAEDGRRTHGDIREAYWRHINGDWEYLIGANRVFWGVTESRHLVNVINQIDGVENIDEEDFLGQPMIQVGKQTDIGRFDAYLMTGFRERTFAGAPGRLRGARVIETSRAKYESDLEEWYPDIALRYSHYIDELDIGLHVFHGTGREPGAVEDSGTDRLVPRYSIISQAGTDLQYTTDAWLWKFEGLLREGQGDVFGAVVAGVEYTFFQINDTDADLGLLAEALYDGRDDDVYATSLENDVFLGARLTLNDVQDTTALIGFTIDTKDGPGGFRIEADRRLGDQFKLSLEGQMFLENDATNPASPLQDDSFATLTLSWFF